MFGKLTLVLLFAVLVSGNPAAKGPWRWIHREATVTPNAKGFHFYELIESVVPQKPKYPSGTVRVDDCGRAPLFPDGFKPAIVNGYETYPHHFPWMVAIYIDDVWFCGGSIISDEWIMTAAHCVQGGRSVQVIAGAHNIREAEPTQVTMTSTDFFTHESFNPSNFHNDIAMIRLPQKLTFNDYIQPVCLPTSPDLGYGAVVNPCGWGSNGYSEYPDTLHAVYLWTITNDDCKKGFGDVISEDMICTGGSDGYGTCSGDSGSPLNYKPNNGAITETRGIVSFGSAAGCTAGYPTGYTRVSHFLGWIQDNTGVTSQISF